MPGNQYAHFVTVIYRISLQFQFGFGMRACIGRPFAWQEVILVYASIVQKFDLEMADPSYTLELNQSLTIKPKNFYIRASLRTDGPTLVSVPSAPLKPAGTIGEAATSTKSDEKKTPLYVFFGSNTGTSEAFAQRVASAAAANGVFASWRVYRLLILSSRIQRKHWYP
jgi:cytochrome P450 / NADPH-cytochrome P450 reductase